MIQCLCRKHFALKIHENKGKKLQPAEEILMCQ